jgi:hypothetical protein
MVALGMTFREAEGEAPSLGLSWNEPYPDHTTIHRAFQEIPQDYLDSLLEMSASECLQAGGWERGLLAGDSTSVETDRYGSAVRPVKKRKTFEEVREIICLKLHVMAVLDLMVILRAKVTGGRRRDAPTLREMLRGFMRLPGSVFDADRGYDADSIFKKLYELKMFPNIKQRETQKGPKGKGHRRLRCRMKAAKSFDVELYHYRGLIEGIWGAEEAKGHSLRTGERKRGCQERWGIMLCIAWNARVWNRLRCAKELGIEVKPILRN